MLQETKVRMINEQVQIKIKEEVLVVDKEGQVCPCSFYLRILPGMIFNGK